MIVAISTAADGSMYNRNDILDPAVITNRETFLAKHGMTMEQTTMVIPPILKREQAGETNFSRYQEVDARNLGNGMKDTNAIPLDAIVTRELNHALFLPIADCVATTLYDPTKKIVMLSHLGRQSLVDQGALKSVRYLVDQYDCDPADLLVWAGPAPNKEVYPIWALDNKGMKEVWFEQMASAGILRANITDNPADTATDLNYFSYSEFLKGHRKEDSDYCMVAMMTS